MSARFTDQFVKATYRGLLYRHFKSKSSNEKLPLIVFLHGVGECGTDNESQLWYSFFNDETSVFSNASLAVFPCHIVAPQAQDENRWVDIQDWGQESISMSKEPTASLQSVVALVQSFLDRPDVDKERVFITGLSMGAFGVYELLARCPKLFSAAVAVCGGADITMLPKIKDVAVRVYHGNKDKVVSVSQSRSIDSTLKHRLKTFEYIELDQVGHNAWDYAFRDESLFPWLFAQRRKA
jgi:predicted peptidase